MEFVRSLPALASPDGSSSSTRWPIASLLLFLTTLCIEFARSHAAAVPQLYSECLCWTVLWLGTLIGARYRPQLFSTEGRADETETKRDTLAWIILATIVIRKLADVDWALPIVTPILYLLVERVAYQALPVHEDDEKVDSTSVRGHWWSPHLPLAGFVVVALGSAVVMSPTSSTAYSISLGLLFVAFETRLLLALAPGAGESSGPHNPVLSFAPSTSGRVAAGLVVGMLLTPAQVPPAALLGLMATLKIVRWISLLYLCRMACATASSTVPTYAAAVFRFSRPSTLHGMMGTAVVALISLVQHHHFLPRSAYRLVITAAVAFISIATLLYTNQDYREQPAPMGPNLGPGRLPARWTVPFNRTLQSTDHPIQTLVSAAHDQYSAMLARQSKTLGQAEAEYRRRYHRSPPPGFDKWYEQAVGNGMVLIDEFDGVMRNLEPFWGLSPRQLRHRVELAIASDKSIYRLSIRNGELAGGGDLADRLRRYQSLMPDLDLAFNGYDEPRVIVPHDRLSQALEACPGSAEPETALERIDFLDVGAQQIWDMATSSCPADSPTREHRASPRGWADLSFIQNATASKNVCDEPGYGDLHGLFISPTSMWLTSLLIPIFSSGKASSFQDIFFPSGSYREEHHDPDQPEDIPDVVWDEKQNDLFWMGSTTGGQANPDTKWRQMHRHRLAEMINDEHGEVTLLQSQTASAGPWQSYRAPMSSLSPLFNVSIGAVLQCEEKVCEDERQQLHRGSQTHPLAGRRSKYVLDLDGNGWSGRFYRLLRSRSTVMKMTIFREWHDDWLIPWVHYVPVSLELTELPETMRFLSQTPAGQDISRYIASEGRAFAETSLRDVDMDLYQFRAMLEYARLVDDHREVLSYRCPASSSSPDPRGARNP